MRSFFPLKFLVLIYSLFFLIPLFLILWLPNGFIYVVIKILLGLWMILTFSYASKLYPQITLGAFLCFVGLFFTLTWFFNKPPLSYLFSFLFIIFYFGKFSQIDKIHNKTEENQHMNESLKTTFRRIQKEKSN